MGRRLYSIIDSQGSKDISYQGPLQKLVLESLVKVLKPLFESNSETPTPPLKIKNAFIVFKFEEEAEDKK